MLSAFNAYRQYLVDKLIGERLVDESQREHVLAVFKEADAKIQFDSAAVAKPKRTKAKATKADQATADVSTTATCEYVLKTGDRKGYPCGGPCMDGRRVCSRHANSVVIVADKSESAATANASLSQYLHHNDAFYLQWAHACKKQVADVNAMKMLMVEEITSGRTHVRGRGKTRVFSSEVHEFEYEPITGFCFSTRAPVVVGMMVGTQFVAPTPTNIMAMHDLAVAYKFKMDPVLEKMLEAANPNQQAPMPESDLGPVILASAKPFRRPDTPRPPSKTATPVSTAAPVPVAPVAPVAADEASGDDGEDEEDEDEDLVRELEELGLHDDDEEDGDGAEASDYPEDGYDM